MRIIQLDEMQTDISTRAHFHPLAIRLYGQHGINAAEPTGSEVRQASPPPPKPLLSPFIPSSSSLTGSHSYPSHTHTHTFYKSQDPVKNLLASILQNLQLNVFALIKNSEAKLLQKLQQVVLPDFVTLNN